MPDKPPLRLQFDGHRQVPCISPCSPNSPLQLSWSQDMGDESAFSRGRQEVVNAAFAEAAGHTEYSEPIVMMHLSAELR
ncbi:MAG: hypothetical protein IOC82_11400 [Aestuariivirga sp.]|nr:hypothetical protein [Aestuariivirga sp.]